jgi:hypothetical protein
MAICLANLDGVQAFASGAGAWLWGYGKHFAVAGTFAESSRLYSEDGPVRRWSSRLDGKTVSVFAIRRDTR